MCIWSRSSTDRSLKAADEKNLNDYPMHLPLNTGDHRCVYISRACRMPLIVSVPIREVVGGKKRRPLGFAWNAPGTAGSIVNSTCLAN
jgi:hypothetical protein